MFSTEKIAVKNDQGKMVEMPASDMAYNVMQKILDGGIKFDEMHMHFQSMEPKTFSPEFLKFMSQKTNLQEIISKEQADYGFITRTYEWFAEREALQNLGEIEDLASGDTLPTSEANRYKIKVYETTPSGIDKLRWREPTVELLAKEFTERRFTGITAENRHIAEYVGQWQNYDQRHFDKAVEIDQERQKLGTPDHITKTPVKQELVDAYRKYIAETDAKRQEILQTAGEVVCDQAESANNIFTYEMLAKSDEANFAMGFLTSCCATLYGAGAGAQRGMIISPDMQPLVIRDNKGNIVSFGIVYVNRKEGYAVVNDFEVNTKYSGNDEARKSIYNTAMAGVDAFAKQYNAEAKESGTAPIKMVTCGRSPNWTAINDFIDQNPQSKILEAPDFSDYKYAGSGMWPGDWHNSQRILWQNGKLVDVDQNEGGNYRG
jgi:hypothetical protein